MLIAQILSHTPIWVWILLAFLVWRGVASLTPQAVSPRRMLLLPVVFFIWGASALYSRSSGFDGALFVVGLAAGAALGRALASLTPAPQILPESGLIGMPGSPIPLVLIVTAFLAKYVGNVALAMAAEPASHASIATTMAAVGGVFAGLFWGRTLRLFQRALEVFGAPSGLADVVAFALSQRRSAP